MHLNVNLAMELVIEFSGAQEGICIARPSKKLKSPYVADVQLDDNVVLAHAPALGMGHIMKAGSKVLVTPIQNANGDKCTHCIQGVYENDVLVGANPLNANKFFSHCFNKTLLPEFSDYGVIKSEVKANDSGSRFDFRLNEDTFVEVKSVLVNDDATIATFPIGNKKKGTISERANKHIDELATLARENVDCYIVFVVLRADSESFSPNHSKDPLFCEKLRAARDAGVKVLAYQAALDTKGIYYKRQMSVNL